MSKSLLQKNASNKVHEMRKAILTTATTAQESHGKIQSLEADISIPKTHEVNEGETLDRQVEKI